jgi:hypothetical protein
MRLHYLEDYGEAAVSPPLMSGINASCIPRLVCISATLYAAGQRTSVLHRLLGATVGHPTLRATCDYQQYKLLFVPSVLLVEVLLQCL